MSDRTVWVAVDIGCIECGEASDLIGIYETREGADIAAAICATAEPLMEEYGYGFFTGGQHRAQVFEGRLP